MSPAESILLVEDDSSIREELGGLLRDEGYDVVACPNGSEALALLRRIDRPCVILLDLMMPVMNGWEFRAQQCADAALARIPVVLLTGVSDGEAQAAALGLPCLMKPFEFGPLLSAVHRHCGAGNGS
jgi:CheY-like chemotaxis protein